jgi:hypothetical protein
MCQQVFLKEGRDGNAYTLGAVRGNFFWEKYKNTHPHIVNGCRENIRFS